ncbi:MAG TPA: DUF1844 domain-containing protein [Chthonomonadaceae bacterium]|nr:DUF1844 domain-containing protein [Chthonomonadaceae bacterium]
MTDQDSPGFTVVDKRRAAQEPSEATPDAPQENPSEAVPNSDAPHAEASPAPSEEHPSDSTETPEDEGFQLPDPTLLLSMAAMQMDTRTFITALLPLFDGMARRSLGFIADPKTGEPNQDLPAAQLAIDCVQFTLSRIESNLPEPERREAQRRLSDLRMNYLAKLREA